MLPSQLPLPVVDLNRHPTEGSFGSHEFVAQTAYQLISHFCTYHLYAQHTRETTLRSLMHRKGLH